MKKLKASPDIFMGSYETPIDLDDEDYFEDEFNDNYKPESQS
jgi:hypothetical protein